jgi:hypothetical protein
MPAQLVWPAGHVSACDASIAVSSSVRLPHAESDESNPTVTAIAATRFVASLRKVASTRIRPNGARRLVRCIERKQCEDHCADEKDEK